MMKGSFHKVYIAILNVCTPNNRAPNYILQKLWEMKGELDKPTTIFGEFNTPLSTIDRTIWEEISNVLKNLTSSAIKIYRILHTTRVKYMFFSSTHR